MEHLSVHGPEGYDAAPQQCHASEPPPIVLLIEYIAHCGKVMASIRHSICLLLTDHSPNPTPRLSAIPLSPRHQMPVRMKHRLSRRLS